jgi:aryl carrier-like protein
VLETLLADDTVQAAAVPVDWPVFFAIDPAAARLPFLSGLMPKVAPAGAPASALARELEAMPRDERRPHLLAYLSDMVIAALKLRTETPIDARQPLFDVGLDSIMALELKDRLERVLGVPLSATLLFVRPTLDALAEYILTDIVRADAPAAAAGAPSAVSEDELTRLLLREIDASRAT